MPPALPPPEPHLYVRGPPIYKHIVSSEDAEKSRIYVLDWLILAYLLREKWATSKQLSAHFNRSRRTINKHLRKLEKLNLVERHGKRRCAFQWYSIPRENEASVAILVRKLRRDFVQGRTYVIFTVLKNQASLQNPDSNLPFQVPYAEVPKSKPTVPSSLVSSLVLRSRSVSVRLHPPRRRNEASVGRRSGSIPFNSRRPPPAVSQCEVH